MSDSSAVFAEVNRCEDEGTIISHGCARTIASWWNNGADTTMYSFVSTGAIHNKDVDNLWARFEPDASDAEHSSPLQALRKYLEDRREKELFAPVGGWSDMWVR